MDTEHIGCDRVSKLLDAYLDGTLTPEEARKVAAHLDNCPECRAAFLLERQLREDIADAAPEVPGTLHERIMNAVSAEISAEKSAETSAETPTEISEERPVKVSPRKFFRGFPNYPKRIAVLAATFLCFCVITVTLVSASLNQRKDSSEGFYFPNGSFDHFPTYGSSDGVPNDWVNGIPNTNSPGDYKGPHWNWDGTDSKFETLFDREPETKAESIPERETERQMECVTERETESESESETEREVECEPERETERKPDRETLSNTLTHNDFEPEVPP